MTINDACKAFLDKCQPNMQFMKNSDPQAALQARNSSIVSSSLVKETITNLNMLPQQTSRLELSWIKAHIGHSENERADQLAREAINNVAIRINTPPSWAAYKQALKTQIYEEWEQR